MKKMSRLSQIVVAAASLLLVITLFVPVWAIYLTAPQYPEGLAMQIWMNQLSGQVEIINGLNHYIGMKHIKAEMFPEFSYLPYIVIGFVALGLLTALSRSRKLLTVFILLLLTAGVAAMYDFWSWGYDYGHNLDPHAAIQVPGLYYQPPLIGHKKLLNFDAYSYPDTGGWIIVAAGLLYIGVWIYEFIKNRQRKASAPSYRKMAGVAAVLALLLVSCESKPEPFAIGKENCADCQMTIMDAHYGAELITSKGKIYKFDDLHCLRNYLSKAAPELKIKSTIYLADFNHPNNFIQAGKAVLVQSGSLKSPMNSNTAAFTSTAEAQKAVPGAIIQTWTN